MDLRKSFPVLPVLVRERRPAASESYKPCLSEFVKELRDPIERPRERAPTDANQRANARYIRVTPAGQRESAPHDIVEVKAGS